jgi:hypothetical protein
MHPTDGELLALIHCEAPEGQLTARHTADCSECRARLEALADADRETGLLLSLLERPAPALPLAAVTRSGWRGPSGSSLAAGLAGLAVVAGAAAAVVPGSPLRSWLGGHRARDAPATSARPSQSAPERAEGAVISLPVEGGVTIALRHRQGSGRIVLVRSRDTLASIEAVGRDVGFTVQQGRVTVENRPPAEGYRISLPPRPATVTVEGEVIWRAGAEWSGDSVVLDLAERPDNVSNGP